MSDSPPNVFLDQLVVWRELAFNGCEWLPRLLRLRIAAAVGARHARGARAPIRAGTATASRRWTPPRRTIRSGTPRSGSCATEGWFHGYLRMLWGKKILEWAPDAPTALDVDGIADEPLLAGRPRPESRTPASHGCSAATTGRGRRRPVFGTVRYMTSESARRKLRMKEFLQKYGQATRVARRRAARLDRSQRSSDLSLTRPGTCCAVPVDATVARRTRARRPHGAAGGAEKERDDRRNEEPDGGARATRASGTSPASAPRSRPTTRNAG